MPGRRGRPLSHETIWKDFKTFSAAWTHAGRHGLVTRRFPSIGIVYLETAEKAAFRARVQIAAEVARGIGKDEGGVLWESLVPTLDEVREVLHLVRERARHPWIFPMVAIAAHTGMRRSKVLRSRVADCDMVSSTALVCEKERTKRKFTTRLAALRSRANATGATGAIGTPAPVKKSEPGFNPAAGAGGTPVVGAAGTGLGEFIGTDAGVLHMAATP